MTHLLNRRFLLSHPAHFIALGAGAGLSRLAPGTAGTLWAWAVFLLLQIWLTPLQLGVLIGAATLVGWWACTVTAQHLGVADPGAIVWDEIIAFWLVLWLVTPTTFGGPVGWADRLFKGFGWRGGWGILFDDLVAAFCTLLVIAIWRSL